MACAYNLETRRTKETTKNYEIISYEEAEPRVDIVETEVFLFPG